MSYEGSCHCGAVSFRVEEEVPSAAISCDCSHCRRKGMLLSFVPAAAMSVVSGEDKLSDYFFNKHEIAHRFCMTCGCEPFGTGRSPGGGEMAAINLRCVPSIDLDRLTIKQFNGASL